MSGTKILGTNASALQNRTRRWSKKLGETYIYTYKGEKSLVQQAFEDFKKDGIDGGDVDSVEFHNDKAVGYLSVTYIDSSDDITADANAIWEVEPTEIFKDIKTHPYFAVSADFQREMATIDNDIREGKEFDSSASANPTHAGRYYGLVLAGVKGYVINGIVIKRTVTVSAHSSLVAAYSDVNRKVTFESIDAPDGILGDMKFPKYSDGVLDPVGDQEWEWLKKMPTVKTTDGGRRFEMVQRWIGAEKWSILFYGGTWDPTG